MQVGTQEAEVTLGFRGEWVFNEYITEALTFELKIKLWRDFVHK